MGKHMQSIDRKSWTSLCLKDFAFLFNLCVIIFSLSACGAGHDGDSSSSTPLQAAETGNYTEKNWTEAFDALHAQIAEQYAFGTWKGIDWYALNDKIRPQIVQAMAINDESGYATALLRYTKSLPDGHVTMGGGKLGPLIGENIGGSYGFGIIGLDDGRVIAHIVTPDGQADEAGIRAGDEILEWNGVPIGEALEQVSTLWTPNPASLATNEHIRIEKYRLLVLDPVDTQSTITFYSSETFLPTTVTLTASDDGHTILGQTALWNENRIDEENPIHYNVMDNGYGYLLLGALESGIPRISIAYLSDRLKEAMVFFTERDVPGIVVDLRGNSGGSDVLAAEFAGYFYSATTFYEYQEYYNASTGSFENVLVTDDGEKTRNAALNIEPQTPHYSGPVVAIVNPSSASSAEGVAMAIQKLPRGRVVSFYGTNGSFGMTGGKALMPEGYSIEFPYGRSLDENRIIQLDSQNGIGGVIPDVRVPMTQENALKMANQEDVELQFAVVSLQSM